MRTLDTSFPLVMGEAGVGVTPGPSHWKSGVPVTPAGRVTEQVRVRESPATMGEEGEEEREMVARSVHGEKYSMCSVLFSFWLDVMYTSH